MGAVYADDPDDPARAWRGFLQMLRSRTSIQRIAGKSFYQNLKGRMYEWFFSRVKSALFISPCARADACMNGFSAELNLLCSYPPVSGDSK
jgi:hypothetical protein